MFQRGAHGGGAGGDLFAIRNENEGAIFVLSLATMLRTITFSRSATDNSARFLSWWFTLASAADNFLSKNV
jgi:hypothetical protein